jgi:hypothetical protein
MASPFSLLPLVLTRRENQFFNGINRIARDAAQAAGRTAVESTQVDTGLARSNWIATTGTPSSSVRPPYAPGSKLGTGERGNAIGAATQHRIALASWNAARGRVFYITNNVSYIALLNFGGPRVGPGNMLALARQAWLLSIKTPRRILR